MYASSIDSAYQLSKAFPRIASKGVLVGKRNYSTLSPEDQEQLALVAAGNSEEVVSQFRGLLMPAHGYSGTSYRISEYVLSATDTDQELPLVGCIISIFAGAVLPSRTYKTFVKLEVYPYKLSDQGEPEYFYSGNELVLPSAQHIIIPTSKLLRKVILYPNPQVPSTFVLVDHLRPRIHYQLTVFLYHSILKTRIWS